MTYSLQDLHDVLAEDQAQLRPPDLPTVMADGRRLRRRRTTARGLGAVAAAMLLVAGAVGVTTQLRDGAGDDGPVLATPDTVAERARLARGARAGAESRVRDLVGPASLEVGAWSATRPDDERASRALPRDDREWATLQWVRYQADLPGGAQVYVLTENDPELAGARIGRLEDDGRFCTNVYRSCRTTRVPGGVVAVERGRTDDGRRALRASFSPADGVRSWVLVEVTVPSGDLPYDVARLTELASDPMMSLPDPLRPDQLPDAG